MKKILRNLAIGSALVSNLVGCAQPKEKLHLAGVVKESFPSPSQSSSRIFIGVPRNMAPDNENERLDPKCHPSDTTNVTLRIDNYGFPFGNLPKAGDRIDFVLTEGNGLEKLDSLYCITSRLVNGELLGFGGYEGRELIK